MVPRTWKFKQTLLRASCPEVVVMEVDESDLIDFPPAAFLDLSDDILGVACIQGTKGILTHIAFATQTRVLCIRMCQSRSSTKGAKGRHAKRQRPQGRETLQRALLHGEEHRKVAFDMPRLALALYHDYELTVVKALDLQSAKPSEDRQSAGVFLSLFGGQEEVYKNTTVNAFKGKDSEKGGVQNLALRAWGACHVGSLLESTKKLCIIAPINTTTVPVPHLKRLAVLTRLAWRLYAMKPTRTNNDIHAEFSRDRKDGKLKLEQKRFKTRLRTSENQTLRVEYGAPDAPVKIAHGHTARVQGKSAAITVDKFVAPTAKIRSIVTLGRDDPTPAEVDCECIVLGILQQKISFFEQDIVRKILEPAPRRRAYKRRTSKEEIRLAGRRLNDSQAAAVHRILSDRPDDQICVVHGPPGTGKTTVIAASVKELMKTAKKGRGIWLLAQSNVAVKNIAEKLADVGFLDFRILVSRDFHFDWHEHLYKKIEGHVIPSNRFCEEDFDVERSLRGIRVILCTLSMLSHPRLRPVGFPRQVPIETVIVDEASQIDLGGYFPLLSHFGGTIKKLVFIGDDKQLAPYGQEELKQLSSVFDLPHLRREALFLDTQYRMPAPIGAFISEHVYDGHLKTDHSITSRQSCILIDIKDGKETASGNSWIVSTIYNLGLALTATFTLQNVEEAKAIVVVARKYHAKRQSFRVITPYDAQRQFLENRLKDAKLPWENTCFNVDSFQAGSTPGNEADYILISVVRSDKIGFLANVRRTNVMLSRCKRGMVICTSRAFMTGIASASLMGELAKEWSDGWVSWADTLQGKF
ncbi:P-loop containing nucleoside triphosphate hydrolase protein [Daedalea quercina L-15889]|uniref:p-loop containing nucleoside triphosphate hydrolase protein n=1 Tax=Daedalea quercina L-15889 TaxID=1314783 RepID=A0A165QJG8_9APHY|nr:P-loop containing nucleoside triphosphate hydrolase protein [Daedalea quercina L-15889]